MLRSMTVTNPSGDSLTISLENSKSSGFQVAGIDGLGPPKADLFMSNMAVTDGSVFNSARVDSRNIVINLIYDGNIEECRHRSYEFFPIKKNITLRFRTDSRVVRIDGFVESNEVAVFSKMEGSSISVMCPNPWFADSDWSSTAQAFSTVESLFEFEYVKPSVVTDGQIRFGDWEIRPSDATPVGDRYIEFSKVEDINSGIIRYRGDVDSGITIRMRMSGNPGNLKLTNKDTGEVMNISASVISRIVGSDLQNGDEIVILTSTGKKSAGFYRGGTYKNVIAAIDKKSNWFKLVRGDNTFVLDALNSKYVAVTINSQILYEGI